MNPSTITFRHRPPTAGMGRRDETELWRLRDENPRAREELVLRYQAFARHMALGYHNGNGSPEDLIQVAMVGLLNAVNRFDYEAGSGFKSFASPTITGEIKRHFRDRIWMIRLPRNIQEEMYSIGEATSELGAELHRTPTAAEIEERANVSDGSVMRAAQGRNARSPKSFDAQNEPDGMAESERIGGDDPRFDAVAEADEVSGALNDLDASERLVLRLRFDEEMTQSEIAERIGSSQMHVSRLIKRTLGKMQATMEDQGRS